MQSSLLSLLGGSSLKWYWSATDFLCTLGSTSAVRTDAAARDPADYRQRSGDWCFKGGLPGAVARLEVEHLSSVCQALGSISACPTRERDPQVAKETNLGSDHASQLSPQLGSNLRLHLLSNLNCSLKSESLHPVTCSDLRAEPVAGLALRVSHGHW